MHILVFILILVYVFLSPVLAADWKHRARRSTLSRALCDTPWAVYYLVLGIVFGAVYVVFEGNKDVMRLIIGIGIFGIFCVLLMCGVLTMLSVAGAGYLMAHYMTVSSLQSPRQIGLVFLIWCIGFIVHLLGTYAGRNDRFNDFIDELRAG